ncbi:Uncharacterised protein (plasmid) [Tsukamurella tyrosinosolvens]|uniref:Uncharacterized protein n=1 Tax=Tsukamurella tyrosinosolvens TaxID=57704 RepID=A0A1H5AYU2_TSUTY|nr:hypothetical protein [Tsukamurella tyrosinosolvens]KXO95207.1 hypothetical protein AXK58_10755 [Tsukamurella tyrosinosolvens]SED47649.1 hypothetical protein SAMN04489793_5050 [Tsukamurella tyrosinosolvens]VEH88858.1 Uncharacterised protein [Tsukamurella tyrosinosolvens]
MSLTIDRDSGLVVVYLTNAESSTKPRVVQTPVIGWAPRRNEHGDFAGATPVYYDYDECEIRPADSRYVEHMHVVTPDLVDAAEAQLLELHADVHRQLAAIYDKYADDESLADADARATDRLDRRLGIPVY